MNAFRRLQGQRGVSTLTITVVLLAVMTISALYATRAQVLDIKTASNQYRYTQAFEMAERGREIGVGYLLLRANTPAPDLAVGQQPPACVANTAIPFNQAVWGCFPGQTAAQCTADTWEYMTQGVACNSGYPTPPAADAGDGTQLATTIYFRRAKVKTSLADLNRVEVLSFVNTPDYANATDPFKAKAAVFQAVVLNQQMAVPPASDPNATLFVAGAVSNVNGTPDICPLNPNPVDINQGNRPDCTAGTAGTSPGFAVATLQSTTAGFDTINTHGGGINTLGTPGDTVHDVLFPGITEEQIKAISEEQYATLPADQRTVIYYGTGSSYGSPPSKMSWGQISGTSPSSTDRAVLVYVSRTAYSNPTQCPGYSPGAYYGLYYFGADCNANGWGNVDIYGGVAVEGDMTRLNANTILRVSNVGSLIKQPGNVGAGQVARVPGSWRDFQ